MHTLIHVRALALHALNACLRSERRGICRSCDHCAECTDFEGMDAVAFWHDIKFSLRHLNDFSRMAVVCNPDTHHLWSSLVAPFMSCTVEHFVPGQEEAARDWLMWPEGAAD